MHLHVSRVDSTLNGTERNTLLTETTARRVVYEGPGRIRIGNAGRTDAWSKET